MSRSGYSHDCDNWDLIRWRGAVASAIRGKRGQALLREIAAALDAMPVKELVANELEADGSYCTLGVVGAARGIELSKIDPDDRETVAGQFGIAEALAAEIMYENDEAVPRYEYVEVEVVGPLRLWDGRKVWERVEPPHARARRWQYMRNWVEKHLSKGQP